MKKQNEWSWRSLLAAAAVVACAWAAPAQAAPAVENVSGFMQGGTEVVRIDFSEALTSIPNGFAIQSPPRIALDVPGASNCAAKPARPRPTRATVAHGRCPLGTTS